MLLNDKPGTIVGIMRRNSGLVSPPICLFRCKPATATTTKSDGDRRLNPGVTIDQAQAELGVIADEYRSAFPRHMLEGESIGAQPYQESFTGDVAKLLWILLGAVSFLLLIACANVANLQLTRAAGRQREIAVRLALGAGTGRPFASC